MSVQVIDVAAGAAITHGFNQLERVVDPGEKAGFQDAFVVFRKSVRLKAVA